MSEQNQEKKSKKGFFIFGKKPEKYDWDIKKERERDRRIVDSFNFAIEGLTAALRNEKHMKTELSHNKIALYKSEKLLDVLMITLFSVLYFSPYMSSFSLPF